MRIYYRRTKYALYVIIIKFIFYFIVVDWSIHNDIIIRKHVDAFHFFVPWIMF